MNHLSVPTTLRDLKKRGLSWFFKCLKAKVNCLVVLRAVHFSAHSNGKKRPLCDLELDPSSCKLPGTCMRISSMHLSGIPPHRGSSTGPRILSQQYCNTPYSSCFKHLYEMPYRSDVSEEFLQFGTSEYPPPPMLDVNIYTGFFFFQTSREEIHVESGCVECPWHRLENSQGLK